MRSPDDRFWVVKSARDGVSSFVYDCRDGFYFVPKYTTREKAERRNGFLLKGRDGRYAIKRSRREKIEKFERDINARNRTPHAKAMRAKEAEVSKAAAQHLRDLKLRRKRRR